MQAFGVFLLVIVAMFFIIPAYDYCINWWWKTLGEQGSRRENKTWTA